MNMQETLDFMQHHPWNFYYVDPINPDSVIDTRLNKAMLNQDEYFGPSSTAYADRRLRLDEIGSMISVLDMPGGWYGVDKRDYSLPVAMCAKVLEGHPERFLVPRMHLDAPDDWLRANPEEVCVYTNGPEKPEEIAALIGGPFYDKNGTRATQDKLVTRQSLSSELWLKEACITLEGFIDHIEAQPWAKQVLGYMVMFGPNGESAWFGGWQTGNVTGDKGISHRRDFFHWAVRKYGSLPALRKAWSMPHLTSDSIRTPNSVERWAYDMPANSPMITLPNYLLAADQRQVDCNEFHSYCVVHAIEELCKIVHERSGKPAGAFYGYTCQPSSGHCGFTGLTQALNSPYIDFLSAPKNYDYIHAGDPGMSQGPTQSITRKKIWVEENDVRSHHRLETNPQDPWSPKTPEDTVTCFWRELYRALTYGFTFWWMNINGVRDDWFTDESMIAMFKQQSAFFKKWNRIPRRSVTEILIVEDDASLNHIATRENLGLGLRSKLDRELKNCGAPVDRYRLCDLFDMDLSRYRFIVFQDVFVLPAEAWAKLRTRIRPDAHLLWNYAAAMLDPAYNPENQKAVTGFRTFETPGRMRHRDVYRHISHHGPKPITDDYPYLSVQPEAGQEVLQSTPDGHIMTARIRQGEGASIFAADITLRTPLLRRLLEDAGVTLYAPEYCSVLADEKLIGFSPRYDVCFTHVFDGQWRNVITGETVTGEATLAIRSKKFAIFERID